MDTPFIKNVNIIHYSRFDPNSCITHLIRRGQDLFNPVVSAKVREWKKGDRDVSSGNVRRPILVDAVRQPLVGKIGAILADRKLPWKYADRIARRTYGKSAVEYCSYTELLKVTQMLAVYQKRHAGETPGRRRAAVGV